MNRMDKYKDVEEDVPSRSEKNQELYKQIYNAYDEFENLVIPPNTREIDLADLKREVTSRDEYRKAKEYGNITNNKIVRKEIIREEQKRENEIYDINELLDKAVSENKKEEDNIPLISSSDYLKKLKVDKYKTNLEKVKEEYNDMVDDTEDESLMHTANLSLEILSDLKGDNENTFVEPIEEDEIQDDDDDDFYSNKYKFSKKDFDNSYELDDIKEEVKKKKNKNDDEDDDEEEEEDDESNSFLKIFFLIFGILLVISVVVYLFYYFGKI